MPLTLGLSVLIATWFSTSLFDNYLANPLLFVILLLAVAGLLMTRLFLSRGAWWKSWFSSGLAIVSCTLFGVIGLYPVMLPSSMDSAFDVTIRNASSTLLTLKIMLGVALVMIPIVILYQTWAYRLFRHAITEEDLASDEPY